MMMANGPSHDALLHRQR